MMCSMGAYLDTGDLNWDEPDEPPAECPACHARMDRYASECPECGFSWED